MVARHAASRRSLGVLARAQATRQTRLSATGFVTTDSRQRKLALKIGLSCPSV
jgi:hypothetical protein